MTFLNMAEEVKQFFPNVSSVQIKIDLNNALREFGQTTGLPYSEVTLTRASAFVSEDTEKGVFLWTLPADVYEVRKVDTHFFDEIRLLNSTMYLSFNSDDITKIRIEYVKVPAALVADSDVSDIPPVFHPAILSRVLEKWYAVTGNPNAAQYHRDIWNNGRKEAKKFYWTRPWRNYNLAITGGAGGGGGGTSPTDKKRVSGRVVLVPGINTVNVGAPASTVTMADALYILMLNGNGIWVTAINPETGLIERTTTTFNVWSADHNSNFEYIIEG
jgi:phage-related protein